MKHLRRRSAVVRLYAGLLSLVLLCFAALTGCLPGSRGDALVTTAAPYPEEDTAAYERYEEQQLKEQTRFAQMEQELFLQEVSNAQIDLHFLLKNPADYGIDGTRYVYAPMTMDYMAEGASRRKELQETLDSFDTALLTADQKATWRILQSFLKTESMADGLELYQQPLAVTIGVQAQLPILLCEYRFYRRQDVDDYLKLLGDIDEYFAQILAFEQQKAEAGLMMSDTSIDHVIESCESYLLVPGNNFMIDTFDERLGSLTDLTEEEKQQYRAQNAALLESDFVPAYQLLIDGMEKLKGTGVNDKGLCGYPEGKAYYEYLVFSSTGTSYASVQELLAVTEQTIVDCLKETSPLLEANPALEEALSSYQFNQTEPAAIMEELKTQTTRDFPALPACSYTLKDVPTALELSLSPAFYLTSPIDDIRDNVIYINRNPRFHANQLYPTIAHEGYPGHLYQTVYFHTNCSSDLRKLLNFPGYSEGWASYVEILSYGLDNGLDPDVRQLLAANSLATLGLHASLDIYINYMGWDKTQVRDYLAQYFSEPDDIVDAIYETMVENPANFLSYFIGCVEFMNMRKTAEKELGSAFDARAFHQFLLDMGNAPFDVIQPYFTSWLMEQKL